MTIRLNVRLLLFVRFASIAIALTAATDAHSEQYTVGGRSIELPSPQGYCKIGETRGEQKFVELTAKATGPSSRILALFLRCEEVAEWRKNAPSELVSSSDWVVLGVILDRDGQLRPMEGVSRKEFVRTLGSAMSKDPALFSRTNADAQIRLNSLVTGADFRMMGTQVLKADDEAIYFILGSEILADNGEHRRVIAVSAITLLKGVRIVYGNYRQVNPSQNGNALFGKTNALVHAAVQANP